MIQSNLFNEFGFRTLVDAMTDLKLDYAVFKAVPFTHDIQWVEGNVPTPGGRCPTMVWGTTSVEDVAEKHFWHPGVFKNENFDMRVLHEKWGPWMLNEDARFYKLGEIPSYEGAVFIRPALDSKSFAGRLMNGDELDKWREDLYAVRDEFTTVDLNTVAMVASPKHIADEARFFVVDRKVVAGSMYRIGGHVMYKRIDSNTPLYKPMWEWAQAHCQGEQGSLVANGWRPHEAFVLDVARTEKGFSTIEVNCLNSAGFYDANMASVVRAIENLHPWPERWNLASELEGRKVQPWEKVIDDGRIEEWRREHGYA
jgi:hypothetical protein